MRRCLHCTPFHNSRRLPPIVIVLYSSPRRVLSSRCATTFTVSRVLPACMGISVAPNGGIRLPVETELYHVLLLGPRSDTHTVRPWFWGGVLAVVRLGLFVHVQRRCRRRRLQVCWTKKGRALVCKRRCQGQVGIFIVCLVYDPDVIHVYGTWVSCRVYFYVIFDVLFYVVLLLQFCPFWISHLLCVSVVIVSLPNVCPTPPNVSLPAVATMPRCHDARCHDAHAVLSAPTSTATLYVLFTDIHY